MTELVTEASGATVHPRTHSAEGEPTPDCCPLTHTHARTHAPPDLSHFPAVPRAATVTVNGVLTGEVTGRKYVVIKVSFNQNSRDPLALFWFLVCQKAHDLVKTDRQSGVKGEDQAVVTWGGVWREL